MYNYLQNEQPQLSEAIQAFVSVTGIQIYPLNKNGTNTASSMCSSCVDQIKEITPLSGSPFYCNLFFCPCGACHIFTSSLYDASVVLISEPIICGISTKPQCSFNKDKMILHISPLKLYNAAKMLYLAANGTLEPYCHDAHFEEFKISLSNAASQGDLTMAEKTMDYILEGILAETGLDFKKTKIACTKIIFLLHELAFQYAGFSVSDKDCNFSFQSFASADSLGKLKQCLSIACDDFMHAVFQTASLKRNAIISQALELIHRNYGEKITQTSVANSVFLSPSYFSKIFKDVTGCNFNQYLNNVRIEKAKELLEKPAISVDEIYKMIGFESRSYFGKIFRLQTGMTPKGYRDAFVQEKRYN